MPSLKAIRTRIASVKNTQKITRAMKLIAAARLRKAQETLFAARPYVKKLGELVEEIAWRSALVDEEAPHPLLVRREEKKIQLIVLSSDRGLAGGYNSNLLRRIERFYRAEATSKDVELVVIGRKGRDYFRRRNRSIDSELAGVTSESALKLSREVTAQAVEAYVSGRADAVYLAFNEFKSAISQEVKIERLLPLPEPADTAALAARPRLDFTFEPSKPEVLDRILPQFVEIFVYRVLLEAVASEFGARMSAMDSANKNAKEMIDGLTLAFNRARQAAITKELVEIVSGAEALKG